jgi:hypothetical protein
MLTNLPRRIPLPRRAGAAAIAVAAGCLSLAAALPAAAAPTAPCDLGGCVPPDAGNVTGCGANQFCPPTGTDPVGGPAPPALPAPAAAAAGGVDGLGLPLIHVHTKPGGAATGTTYTKLLTYLYLDGWHPATSAPIPAQGGNVTLTATPDYANWDLGEAAHSCKNPGSPNSAECSYTYNRSSPKGGRTPYSISATVFFKVSWACDPGCGQGTLPDEVPDTSVNNYTLNVTEIQGVN